MTDAAYLLVHALVATGVRIVLALAVAFVSANLVVDLLYAKLDPRIDVGGGEQ